MRIPRWVALLTAVLGWAVALRGETWPQWRGPFLNGSGRATHLPASWSKQDGIRWGTPLPGKSGATPAVTRDWVFVPTPDDQKVLWLMALDRGTGEVRWRAPVSEGDREIGKNNMASCSPATDGERVYVMFGTGDLAAYEVTGKELWKRRLASEYGTFAVLFLYGASPLLHDGRLYVPLLQRHPPSYGHARDDKPDRQSWLVCLEAATGRTLWAAERPTTAPEEAMEAYTTPVPLPGDGGTQILLSGADCVTGHDALSGEELWRYGGLNARKNPGGRIVPSPVAMPGRVFACGPKREVLVALSTSAGRLPDADRVLWRQTQFVPDVCTPLLYQGRLFVLDGDRQVLTCYRPETGELVYQGRLGVREIFYSSPTGADGKIYCLSEEGTVVVVSAGDGFEVLGRVPMGEGPCRASVVAAGGDLFIRTAKNLYCVRGTAR